MHDGADHNPHYAWRFLIDEVPPAVSPLDAGRELLRVQWEQLLALTIPSSGDKQLTIDGFALRRDTGKIIPVYLDDRRWTRFT